MTREELIAEIQVLHTFTQTWFFKNTEMFDKNNWQMYCYKLLYHYLSDKDEVFKEDLEAFDVFFPEFSIIVMESTCSKSYVIDDCRQELKRLQAHTDLIDDKWLYSYDSVTGEVACLNIIVRGNNYRDRLVKIDGDADVSNDYDLFKAWLFTSLTKFAQIPGVKKSVYYIDSAEWKIVKQNFPRMVRRLVTGSRDICNYHEYYREKEREKQLEDFISKVEADSDDTQYVRTYSEYKKIIVES